MGNSSTKSDQKQLRPHVLRVTSDDKSDEGRSAVIMGPTGATGKYILSYLIASPEWKRITIIHRREVDLDEISKRTGITFTDEQKAKVTQHKVDMEKLCENDEAINANVELFRDHEITFCVLGTKRSVAKSAENFRKVDLYMVRDGAILSKKAGIPQFSLLTSKGSNANMWANDWKITHGLLYLKVKGDAEKAVIDQGFERISIFRPGVLGREGESGGIMSKLPVRNLAAVMVYDAESDEVGKKEDEQDKKMVDEPMEKIEAKPKEEDGDDEKDKDKDKDGDVEKAEDKDKDNDKEKLVEEEKTEKVEPEAKGVKDIIFYEADDIDNVMEMAMKNFNGVCGELKVAEEVKEEPKAKDKAPKEEVVDAPKEKEADKEEVADEDKDKDKDQVVKEEVKKDDNEKDKEDGDKQEDVEEEPAKYEVVEKPKEEAANEENVNEDEPKKEKEDQEITKDDYVEVDKADASKEDVNGGDE